MARQDIDGSVLDYFAEAVLDVDATLMQLQLHEDARRGEVTVQLEQAEREQLRLAGERDRPERDYRAGDLPARRYDGLCVKIEEEQGAAAAAHVEQLRARERELSAESLLASIAPDTTEQLTEIRARIVEHVRGAGSLDAVRAALLTLFKGFTFDGLIEMEPREEAIIGHHVAWDDSEPIVRKTPLAMRGNNHSNSSPSQ